jgi:hypothetical protein
MLQQTCILDTKEYLIKQLPSLWDADEESKKLI